MKILILEDDKDDLQRMLDILNESGRTDIITGSTIEQIKVLVPQEPFIFLTDYFLVSPDTGIEAIKEVLIINEVMHFMVVSSAPTVTVLSDIINLNHGFAFLDKNKDDFPERLVNKLSKLETGLTLKVAKVIRQEKERIEREKRDMELLEEAKKVLKLLE